MPNRILKESICTSETLDMLSAEEERFFYRLIVQCDDYGRMDARPQILRAKCFPLKTDELTNEQIQQWLGALVRAGLVRTYEVGGKPYLMLVTWSKHQQVRAKKSKCPPPPESDSNCNQLQSDASRRKQTLAGDSNGLHMSPYSDSESYSKTESESEAGIENRNVTLDQNPPPQPPPSPDLVKTFEQEFARPLSPMEMEQLGGFEATYGPALTVEALRRAVTASRFNFRYVEGILKSWQRQKLSTLQQVREYEERRQAARSRDAPTSAPRADPELEAIVAEHRRRRKEIAGNGARATP